MATWEYKEPMRWNDTVMVFCTVTAFGKAMTSQLPVMNHRNQAIQNPDAFAVNTAMQRCLAKAIALHGLGLYIYAGEDIPENEAEAMAKAASVKGVTPTAGAFDNFSDEETKFLTELAQSVTEAALNDVSEAVALLDKKHLEAEEKVAVWSLLDSKVRSAIKKEKSKPTSEELIAQA
jgi:aminopeptidase N